MAHEIMQHDNVVLHKERAWHGLGIVVESAPSPQEALKIAGLDWEVEQWPLSATNGEDQKVAVENYVLNIRKDTRTQLGVVGVGYTPIQNRDLADFASALAEMDGVKVETAGSIRNGQKVWFLLRGESFAVKDQDEIKPYILVSNGHDGGTALRCTPTTVRVVCSNTLHMVIPRREAEGRIKAQAACYAARHTGNVKEKVEEAKRALNLYGRSLETNRTLIDQLAARDMNHEAVRRFFLECYARDFESIPTDPKSKKEKTQRDNAMDAVGGMLKRFEKEEAQMGASAWTALNAYTGWLQHDRKIRRTDAVAREELRLHSQLFGVDADRTTAAYAAALTI